MKEKKIFFFFKYEVEDKVAQLECSNIKCYASVFSNIYIYIYICQIDKYKHDTHKKNEMRERERERERDLENNKGMHFLQTKIRICKENKSKHIAKRRVHEYC